MNVKMDGRMDGWEDGKCMGVGVVQGKSIVWCLPAPPSTAAWRYMSPELINSSHFIPASMNQLGINFLQRNKKNPRKTWGNN